jgi:hypothetical protein
VLPEEKNGIVKRVVLATGIDRRYDHLQEMILRSSEADTRQVVLHLLELHSRVQGFRPNNRKPASQFQLLYTISFFSARK